MCPAKKPALWKSGKISLERSKRAQVRRIKALLNQEMGRGLNKADIPKTAKESFKSGMLLTARIYKIPESKIPILVNLADKLVMARITKQGGREEAPFPVQLTGLSRTARFAKQGGEEEGHYRMRAANFLVEECGFNAPRAIQFMDDFSKIAMKLGSDAMHLRKIPQRR